MVRLFYKPSQKNLLQEGNYLFEVFAEPKKGEGPNGGEYFIFKFKTVFEDGSSRILQQYIAAWEECFRDLLEALGGHRNEHGEVDMDSDGLIGLKFEAQVVHIRDSRDPQITREKLIHFKPVESVIEDADENLF